MVKQINNYWIDDNNNKWDCDKYSQKIAQELSKTMINCSNCSYCSYCSNCRSCSYFVKNPQRYTTPHIGSRNDTTTIYWTNIDNAIIVCGCYKGSLKSFENRVKNTYDEKNKHRTDYLKQINIMYNLIKR